MRKEEEEEEDDEGEPGVVEVVVSGSDDLGSW